MLANLPRLQARLDRDGLDGIVAATPENIFYLTGIQPSAMGQMFAIVTRDAPGEVTLVTSVASVDQIPDGFGNIKDVLTYGTFYREMMEGTALTEVEEYVRHLALDTTPAKAALDAVVAGLQTAGLADKKVAFEAAGAGAALLDGLRGRISGTVQAAGDLFRWVRMVKTEEEVRRLRLSAHITERALIACQGVFHRGVTEIEVAREFERSIINQGAVRRILHVRFGRNGVMGLGKESHTPLEEGDTVWFDVGCVYEGYCSDLARVFSLGEPSPRIRQYYAAMLAGEEAAIAQARPGMTAGELFELTMQAVREGGVPHYRRHHVGHAIGLEVYDAPLIGPGVTTPLEEGMVITIETPYYEFGFGAVHAEDPFLMTATGNIVLTDLSRDLGVVEG